TAICSESYCVFSRCPHELIGTSRPSEWNGRLGVPPPRNVGALISSAAYPPVPLAPTYAVSTAMSYVRRLSKATFHVWMYPRLMLLISGVYSAAAGSSGTRPELRLGPRMIGIPRSSVPYHRNPFVSLGFTKLDAIVTG